MTEDLVEVKALTGQKVNTGTLKIQTSSYKLSNIGGEEQPPGRDTDGPDR